jgi:hypothetical protein
MTPDQLSEADIVPEILWEPGHYGIDQWPVGVDTEEALTWKWVQESQGRRLHGSGVDADADEIAPCTEGGICDHAGDATAAARALLMDYDDSFASHAAPAADGSGYAEWEAWQAYEEQQARQEAAAPNGGRWCDEDASLHEEGCWHKVDGAEVVYDPYWGGYTGSTADSLMQYSSSATRHLLTSLDGSPLEGIEVELPGPSPDGCDAWSETCVSGGAAVTHRRRLQQGAPTYTKSTTLSNYTVLTQKVNYTLEVCDWLLGAS